MDDDLLFHNKFVPNLEVPSTYDIKNKNKEAAFRQYIEKKKNIVGLNDEDTDIFEEQVMRTNPLVVNSEGKLEKGRRIVENRYIYNISSKMRQTTQSTYVEREIVTGEYVKVSKNIFNEDIYEPIDIDELNTEYNALDVPNAVVNPFYMLGDKMYFKTFLYRTPDEYIIDLPLMHTNVKSVRLLSSVIPCTITNINKYNNHVMMDILFGSDQILENLDYDIVFGTLIMKIPYGNYSIDEVCTKLVTLINNFYFNNYTNNTGNTLYDVDKMLSASFFSYYYEKITGELYFSMDQPSNLPTIETLVIVPPKVYENMLEYDGGDGIYNTILIPVTPYDDFMVYARTIAATMTYNFCDYGNSNYVEQFIILQKGGITYLSSLFDNFNIDMTANYENIRSSLNLGTSGIKSSTNGILFFVDITNGYELFETYNSTISNVIIFTVGATNYSMTIGVAFYTSYIQFIEDVINAMNIGYPTGNFELSVQQQYKFNNTTYNYDIVDRYYITASVDFKFNCDVNAVPLMDSVITEVLFGYVPQVDVTSTVHTLVISAGPDFPYTPTPTTEIYFTFSFRQYTAYIPSIAYSTYESFITTVVDAMNTTCKSGFFAFDREGTEGNYTYSLYSSGDFTMQFSLMPSVGTVMVHPPSELDQTSTDFKLDLTAGYNAYKFPYDAYARRFSHFYLNIRQKVPDPPYQDDPARTNTTVQVPLVGGTYSDINSIVSHIISQLNNVISNASWTKPASSLTFAYSIVNNKITISCTSTPEDTYEFSIDGRLMVAFASFLGIPISSETVYVTSYSNPYVFGNRLRFKLSFENNPDVSEDDQLWYMLGFRSNNSLGYVDKTWSNMFDYGNDSYYFSSTSFVSNFIPSRTTETLPDIEDIRPFRLPFMTKANYIYLQLNNYENMYDPSIPNEKIYTKILIDKDYGEFTYDTFVDNPYVFSTTDSRLDRLQLKFIDKNANPVDFNNINHTLSIEIVEYGDRLTANDYNTRRGYNEHTSYPQALRLGHGK